MMTDSNTPLVVLNSEQRIIYRCSVAQEHGQPEWPFPWAEKMFDVRGRDDSSSSITIYTVRLLFVFSPQYIGEISVCREGLGKLFVRSQ
jgi:hypothetical protein